MRRLATSMRVRSEAEREGEEQGPAEVPGRAVEEADVLRRVRGERVLVLIHGFNTPMTTACDAFREIAERFDDYAPAAYDRILGFTWPGGDASYHYFSAKRRLPDAGRHLRRWVKRLQGACRAVDLLAHSLGSRLVRQALTPDASAEKAPHVSESETVRVRNLFAVAPALRLSDVTEAPDAPMFDRGFLFYTRNDTVLGRWFPLFEWESALGYAGPEVLPDLSPPAPVTAVNCDRIVGSHVDYLDHEAFYRYLAGALDASPSPEAPCVRWDALKSAP
jgi:esterase/lipase superfamily enzyme